MARKPNYSFERHERDRAKAIKLAAKAEAKRQLRERDRVAADDAAPAATIDGAPGATPVQDEA
jgi:hypothetical protein